MTREDEAVVEERLRATYAAITSRTSYSSPPRTPIMGEALHDEPRVSVRRSWRRIAVAVAAAAALIVATIALVRTASDDGGTVQTPARPAPTAPAPTPTLAPLVQGPDPASTLLESWGQVNNGYVFIYADGRVIWNSVWGFDVDAQGRLSRYPKPPRYSRDNNAGFRFGALERRLSSRGLELVRTGRLDPKYFVQATNKGRDGQVLYVRWHHQRKELWAEPTARLYEASTYAICHTPAALLPASAQLPASAEALLSGKQRTVDRKIGWSASSEAMREDVGGPDDHGGYLERLAATELAFPSDCYEVTAAEASTLYQILDANGMINPGSPTTQSAGTPPSDWVAGGSRSAEILGGQYSVAHISSEPIYPHGQPVRWWG
jgi:hypothetical protein